MFSCVVKSKIASLCASRDLAENSGTLHYRYGRARALELVYPETSLLAKDAFEGGIMGAGGGDFVRFRRGAMTYTVESVIVRGRGEVAGVSVRQGARTIFEGNCRSYPLSDEGWAAVYRAKLPQKPYIED